MFAVCFSLLLKEQIKKKIKVEIFSGFLKILLLIYLVSGLTSEDLRPLLKKGLTPLKLILGLCPLLKHSPTLTESELQLIVEALF